MKESNTKTKHGVERSRRSKEFPLIVDDGFVGGEGVDGRGCYKGVILVRGSFVLSSLLGGAGSKKEDTRCNYL